MRFRLVLDCDHSATFNMAADEYLMEVQKTPEALPTLRVYSWERSAVSIGYFQNTQEVERRLQGKAFGAIVRRITGGGLVTHGKDLTFSLTMKNESTLLPTDVKMSYLKISEALRIGLKDLYPELDYADCKTLPSGRGQGQRVCFEEPACYDLLIQGKKILGASQRRKEGVILHQSSLFLPDDFALLTEKILAGFQKSWEIQWETRGFEEAEIARIKAIELERYSQEEWALPTATRPSVSS